MSAPSAPADIPPCGCGSPGRALPSTCYCSVDDLLRVIRRRYSLAVMNAVYLAQPCRYREIAARLAGASSSTLADTLGALEAAHLIVRSSSETVPTTTYTLTPAGEKLLNRLRTLLEDIQQ